MTWISKKKAIIEENSGNAFKAKNAS